MHTFYLIRHGESTAAKKGLIVGATDVPLSRFGVQQMEAVAQWLADKPLKMVYSSPMRRAAEPAAELAAARKIPHSEVMDFTEIDFGEWEGQPADEIARKFPEESARAKAGSPLFTFPGGENIEFFRRRVQTAFAQVVRLAPGPAAIYAHGGSIRMILAAAMGISLADAQKLEVAPGGINVIEPNGAGFKVSAQNFIEHLPKYAD